MQVYPFTYFTRQVSRSQALTQYRNAINSALQALGALVNFHGQAIVVSNIAKQKILQACGSTMVAANTHIYETPIGGHWRIFFAPSTNGGIIVLMIGHLQGNVLEEP